MAAKKVRETEKHLRDEAVYQYYIKVLKDIGDDARYMNKIEIYAIVAEPFFVCPETVSRIVRNKFIERQKKLDRGLHNKLRENTEKVLDAIRKAKTFNHSREY